MKIKHHDIIIDEKDPFARPAKVPTLVNDQNSRKFVF